MKRFYVIVIKCHVAITTILDDLAGALRLLEHNFARATKYTPLSGVVIINASNNAAGFDVASKDYALGGIRQSSGIDFMDASLTPWPRANDCRRGRMGKSAADRWPGLSLGGINR